MTRTRMRTRARTRRKTTTTTYTYRYTWTWTWTCFLSVILFLVLSAELILATTADVATTPRSDSSLSEDPQDTLARGRRNLKNRLAQEESEAEDEEEFLELYQDGQDKMTGLRNAKLHEVQASVHRPSANSKSQDDEMGLISSLNPQVEHRIHSQRPPELEQVMDQMRVREEVEKSVVKKKSQLRPGTGAGLSSLSPRTGEPPARPRPREQHQQRPFIIQNRFELVKHEHEDEDNDEQPRPHHSGMERRKFPSTGKVQEKADQHQHQHHIHRGGGGSGSLELSFPNEFQDDEDEPRDRAHKARNNNRNAAAAGALGTIKEMKRTETQEMAMIGDGGGRGRGSLKEPDITIDEYNEARVAVKQKEDELLLLEKNGRESRPSLSSLKELLVLEPETLEMEQKLQRTDNEHGREHKLVHVGDVGRERMKIPLQSLNQQLRLRPPTELDPKMSSSGQITQKQPNPTIDVIIEISPVRVRPNDANEDDEDDDGHDYDYVEEFYVDDDQPTPVGVKPTDPLEGHVYNDNDNAYDDQDDTDADDTGTETNQIQPHADLETDDYADADADEDYDYAYDETSNENEYEQQLPIREGSPKPGNTGMKMKVSYEDNVVNLLSTKIRSLTELNKQILRILE